MEANATADDDGDGIRNGGDVDWTPPILAEDADGDGIPNGEDADFAIPVSLADDDGDGIRNFADADYVLPTMDVGVHGGCGFAMAFP
jgi:hypothetical protein